jgi:hypothetical protein
MDDTNDDEQTDLEIVLAQQKKTDEDQMMKVKEE